MSTTDFIALAAVFVSILAIVVTTVGWLFSYLAQRRISREIEAMREEFAFARERRNYLIPAQLADISEIRDWLTQGLQLVRDINELLILKIDGGMGDENSWRLKCQTLIAGHNAWQGQFYRCYALAFRFDPLPLQGRNLSEYYFSALGRLRALKWSDIQTAPEKLIQLLEEMSRITAQVRLCLDTWETSSHEGLEAQKRSEALFSTAIARLNKIESNAIKGQFTTQAVKNK